MKSGAAIILSVLSQFVLADDCLKYSQEVTLQGTLSRQTFPEQPNYESIEDGDTPASYLFISPRKPFCVSIGNLGGSEPDETVVASVQLVFTNNAEESYAALRPELGKEVVCAGSFMHSITGHHHSPVLLWKAKCSGSKSQK